MKPRREPAEAAEAADPAAAVAAVPAASSTTAPPAADPTMAALTPGLYWRPLLLAAVLLGLAWYLRYTAMLFFAAILVAGTLHALAEPLARGGRVSPRTALAVVLVALPALLVAMGAWIGDPLMAQLQTLAANLPWAWAALRAWLDSHPLGGWMLSTLDDLSKVPVPWAGIAGVAGDTLRALSAALLIVLMGVYLAFDVGLYQRGLVRLFPLRQRARVNAALDEGGRALMRWLLGQGIAMLAVGAMVAAGLSLLGMPLALALGLIAGLLEFIPFFGPIASGLLAVLIAFVQGPQAALYVALLFIVIQQIEGNVLVPLIQRWTTKLPPLLGVAAVIVFGSLFGFPGVLFGTPLMVVTMVLVRRLYVEQTLEGQAA